MGPKIHTQFLRVLAITARASPKRSVSLIQMNVVDTLFQILTGVSPPSGDGDISNKIDKVMIMQSLIHRPRDQISETLNVICELLPNVTVDGMHYLDGLMNHAYQGPDGGSPRSARVHTENRSKLLEGCKDELRRFIVILMPTLTDAYSSTVNYSVRQRVLTAQLKMLSNIDVDILEDALRHVGYSKSFLGLHPRRRATIPLLVTLALQAAETLLRRMDNIYRYQFYREGVMAEINALASKAGHADDPQAESKGAAESIEVVQASSDGGQAIIGDLENGLQ